MCGSNFRRLVPCFVGLCHLQKHLLAVACAKMGLLVTMHFVLCVFPGTMDQKDSNVRDEAQSKRRKLMDELETDIPELKSVV